MSDGGIDRAGGTRNPAGRRTLVLAMAAIGVVLLAPFAFMPLLPVPDHDAPVRCAIAGNPTVDVVHASALRALDAAVARYAPGGFATRRDASGADAVEITEEFARTPWSRRIQLRFAWDGALASATVTARESLIARLGWWSDGGGWPAEARNDVVYDTILDAAGIVRCVPEAPPPPKPALPPPGSLPPIPAAPPPSLPVLPRPTR